MPFALKHIPARTTLIGCFVPVLNIFFQVGYFFYKLLLQNILFDAPSFIGDGHAQFIG